MDRIDALRMDVHAELDELSTTVDELESIVSDVETVLGETGLSNADSKPVVERAAGSTHGSVGAD